MRGATWFEKGGPEGVVWLLAVEAHDERHKGRSDAYDKFAALDAAGRLFPVDVDYKLLRLNRLTRDTADFADRAARDYHTLVTVAVDGGQPRAASRGSRFESLVSTKTSRYFCLRSLCPQSRSAAS
jgi:hypothetical protein